MKAPKRFAIWSFSSSSSSISSSSSSRSSSSSKRRNRYTKNTEEKEAGMRTDKNAHYWTFLALFQGKELCFVLCG